ncbi:MAG: CaiB/BaiF CoA-transferase family protein [Chloroflexota bacterium]|nr:CaiB/BaiF CoA-transferase family protein [Chloroflexota bacterium]
MSGPLEGIKVVDFTLYAFGPRASQYLVEMGAEVIKIENPEGGEPLRGEKGLRGVPMDDFNAYFEQVHRGKKSLAIDLRHDRARQAVYRLVEGADVFVTNFRLGGLERLGMDYDTLSKLNPRLIYAIGTGWGLKGPARDRGAFEVTGYAGSGLVTTFADAESRPPVCPPAFGDYTAATLLAYGIALALYHRERTGKGQMVHTSLLGAFMKVASCCVDASIHAGKNMFGMPHNQDIPFYALYETKDKRWIQMAALPDYRAWPELCQTLRVEHLLDDPRFATTELRRENGEALIAIFDEAFRTKTQSEWVALFDKHSFPWSPVRHFPELVSDPQVLENEYLVTLDHPQAGKVQVVGVNLDLSETPGSPEGVAPELGQHTEEVLIELGYSWDDIIAMKEEGAIL